jgi:O-acetyl-ADP-ribose deacetylase (regulator of RNase III)
MEGDTIVSWLETLDIECIQDDILSIECDALACTVSRELECYGKISKKLFSTCAPHFGAKVSSLRSTLREGAVEIGEAVSLQTQPEWNLNAGHIILVAMWDFQSEYTQNLFYKAYINSIRRGLDLQVKSMALPVMDYHHGGKAAHAICEVILDLGNLRNSGCNSIEHLMFVSTRQEHVQLLEARLREYGL